MNIIIFPHKKLENNFLWPFTILSLISNPANCKVGQKRKIPEKKTPDQTELGLSQMWPELGSNPQQWDDQWFRALKISRPKDKFHLALKKVKVNPDF